MNPKHLLASLDDKIPLVRLDRERERVMLFARTFASRVTSWNGREVLCIDVVDIERQMRRKPHGALHAS